MAGDVKIIISIEIQPMYATNGQAGIPSGYMQVTTYIKK